jgi:hypothetical protein
MINQKAKLLFRNWKREGGMPKRHHLPYPLFPPFFLILPVSCILDLKEPPMEIRIEYCAA